MTKYALVGDVGGTNARLALCDVSSGEISRAKTYSGITRSSAPTRSQSICHGTILA
jgi:glucokinase